MTVLQLSWKHCLLLFLWYLNLQVSNSYISLHVSSKRPLQVPTVSPLSRQSIYRNHDMIRAQGLPLSQDKQLFGLQSRKVSGFFQSCYSWFSKIRIKANKSWIRLGSFALPIAAVFFWGISRVVAKGANAIPETVTTAIAAGTAAASIAASTSSQVAVTEVQSSFQKLINSFQGVKLDSLLMLVATSIVIPLFIRLKYSPIIGFLLMGTILGPNGFKLVRDVHMIDVLGELGIIFFLFEMGLELSLERLNAMKKDVFGLGTSQLLVTSFIGTFLAHVAFKIPIAGAFTIGASLALSSSAFVLQLLKDANAMGSRHGKASFGILLLQDLAVVPLLIIVQLLSEGGAGIQRALLIAATKAMITLSTMSILGKKFLDPIFSIVAKSKSHEAFLSIILSTVLLMSFLTEGIGLSHSLGAFLAGLLLSETRFRYQIEADIAPFRGLLLGIFFMTVGFSIDIKLLFKEGFTILSLLGLLIGLKAGIIVVLSLLFGIPIASAIITGLLNAQGGEFAFVSLGIAQNMGLLPDLLSKKLLTTVALSMAVTPMLSDIATVVSKRIEETMGYKHYAGQDKEAAQEVQSDYQKDFIVVCGYGRIGMLICQLLDRKFVKYLVFDNSPQVAIEARNKGLPVFYGDVQRPEMLKHFNVGKAKVCIITFDEMSMINKAVVKLRKSYPDLPIVVRAKNEQHRQRLENMFDNVTAINPAIEEDSTLLFLPFCSAMLEKIGVRREEVEVMVEDVRRTYLESTDNNNRPGLINSFMNTFRRSSNKAETIGVDVVEGHDDDVDSYDEKTFIAGDSARTPSIQELVIAPFPNFDDEANSTALENVSSSMLNSSSSASSTTIVPLTI